MAFVKCKDCIHGDCFAGKNRSCQVFPAIGTAYTVTDDFFCFTHGVSRAEAKAQADTIIENRKKGEG